MNKFFEFLEKRKGLVLAVTAIVVVVMASFGFYKTNVDDDKQTLIKSNTIGGITSFDDAVELDEGSVLEQSYKCDSLGYKQIGFVAHAADDDAELMVAITDGKHTQNCYFKAADLAAGYTYVNFDDELKNSAQKQVKLSFEVKSGKIVLSANKTVPVADSECLLNGEVVATNVVIDMRTLKEDTGAGKYLIIAAASIAFLVVLLFIIKRKMLSVAGITAVILAFFSIVCISIFSPFTVPDEAAHYRSIYYVSNMMMFNFDDEPGALQMRECDHNYLMSSNNSLYNQSYVSEKGFDEVFVDNTDVITTDKGYMTNKLIPHFAGGLGLSIGRIIGLGPYWAFMLARIFNIAQCILLVYFAIKIIPFGKVAMAAISLLPINLHILASCSYDAFTFGGVVLMFAYILRLMYSEEKVDWKQLLILAVIIIAVVPQKVVYIGVAALLLLIPKDKFAKPKMHFAFKCALGVLAVASILVLQGANSDKVVSNTVTNSTTEGFGIGYVLSHPIQMLGMLFNTIIEQGDFYIKSMISYFGWFEFQTPWFMAIPYVVVLCLAFMRKKDEPKVMGLAQRSYSLILFGIVFLLIELLLLLDHTYAGSGIILGVQGRYFIPALPLLFLFVRNNTIELKQNFDMKLLYLMGVLNSGIFIYSCSKIV